MERSSFFIVFATVIVILMTSCANLDPVTVNLLNQRLAALEASKKGPVSPESSESSVTIWIDLNNGSRLPVKIVQISDYSFRGPKGEIYHSFPSREELAILYVPNYTKSRSPNKK